jgi:uncharacterized protein
VRTFAEGTRREIIFVLTESCNLDCVYCYEANKNRKRAVMSADFIKQKIHNEMLADDGYTDVSFGFFGGEPLLRFDTIREVVEWFSAMPWPQRAKTSHFTVTTNATLLNDRMKDWFAKHRDQLTLCLSMDGTKAAQDRNRSESYDRIAPHIGFFRENWPDQPVKMTVSPHSIDQTYEGVVHIHSLGLAVEPDVVFEDVWGDADSTDRAVRVWAEQLDRLVDFYVVHPELRRPQVLRRRLVDLFSADSRRSRTFCGAGRHLICFTPDGGEFPCFRFAPISTRAPLRDVLSIPQVENKTCNECAFEKICLSCEGHNYAVTGSCFNRTTYHCRFFQASLLASAKLLLLENPDDVGPLDECPSRDQKLERLRRLLAIRAVNDFCAPIFNNSSPAGCQA